MNIVQALRTTLRLAMQVALLALIAIVLTTLRPPAAVGATITVTAGGDILADDAECTLREAITAANLNSNTHEDACAAGDDAGTDTIVLTDGAQYFVNIAGAGEDGNATGDFDILNNTADIDVIINVTDDGTALLYSSVNDRILHILPDTAVEGTGLMVWNGKAVEQGAGILHQGSALTLNNSFIQANLTTDTGLGGGIYNNGGTLTIENGSEIGSVDIANFGNRADYGGGIYNNGGTVTIDASSVLSNLTYGLAGDHGGGIYSDGGTINVLNGSSILGNNAVMGAGIYNDGGTVTVTASAVSQNTARNNGGGIANRNGGSITVDEGSTISENVSPDNGGGIWSFGTGNTVTIDASTIADNEAEFAGGGIYNEEGTLDVLNASLIDGNSADFYGGGIANYGSNTVATLDASMMSLNTAARGGGIYNDYGTVDVENLSYVGLPAEGNSATGFGGGIYNISGSVTVLESVVSDNDAADGGGLYNDSDPVTPGTITLDGAIVANNGAYNGGGVYNNSNINAFSLLTLQNESVIGFNCANGSGGGLYNAQYSDADVTDGSVIGGNCAFGAGGGIFNFGTLDLDNAEVAQNGAGNGGGIANVGTANLVNESSVWGNDADSAGGIDNFGLLTITDSEVSENYGEFLVGGINIEPFSSATITGSVLYGNLTDGVAAGIMVGESSGLGIEDSALVENISVGDGGAIYVQEDSGLVLITNSYLGFNEATNGSGIYSNAVTDDRVNITSSCIVENSDTALWNNDPSAGQIATGNYWGEPDGPFPIGSGDSFGGDWDVSGWMTDFPDYPGNGCGLPLLTIEATGDGSGTMDNSDFFECTSAAGIVSGECFVYIQPIAEIEALATADAGSSFEEWTGCDITSGGDDEYCTIFLTWDRTISAEFDLDGSPDAPEITSDPYADFEVGVAGSFFVEADGNPAPSFSYTGTLPSGLSFDGTTGEISGTPDAGTSGEYALTFTATNGISPDDTQDFTLYVNEAPQITSADNTTFTVGSAGSFFVTTTGYPEPCFCLSGTLPDGVFFDSLTGELYGTPEAGTGGEYTLSIVASNGIDPDATQTFTLVVEEAIEITSPDTVTFYIGVPNSPFTVTATGYPEQLCFCLSGTLPAGVTFNSTTGVLSGNPASNTEGTYPLTITASNGVSQDVQNFTLVVAKPALVGEPLGNKSCTKMGSIVNMKLRNMVVGRSYTYTMEVRDANFVYMTRQFTMTFAGPAGTQTNFKWIMFPVNDIPALSAPQTYWNAWTSLPASVTLKVTAVDRTTNLRTQTSMTYTCGNGIVTIDPGYPIFTPNAAGAPYAP